jgi:hypothetical protein
LAALIQQQVTHALGRPPGPRRVEVRGLWGACYRVNVLTGAEGLSATITSSYFVELGEDGRIVRSSPPLPAREAS